MPPSSVCRVGCFDRPYLPKWLRRSARRWILAVLLVALPLLAAASNWLGSPPYSRFEPDLNVYPQHFAVAQTSDGVVFVGSREGVLEFDGEQWRLLPLPNRDLVRSLSASGRRVYVGGYNSFGYVERDRTGRLQYTELSGRFVKALAGREFADIWGIAIAPEGVYFRAVRDVFLWNPANDRQAHWHRPERFGVVLHHQGRTLLQFREEGFRVRVGDGWQPLAGSEHLRTLVYRLLPLPDGSVLTLGTDGAWWKLTAEGVVAQPMPAGLPPSSQFEHALTLSDGSLALAAGDGQVYLVEPGLRRFNRFRLDTGFLSGVHAAQDGGFLVVSNRALFRVGWPNAWSVIEAAHGIVGTVQGLFEWNGEHYLATGEGAFRLREDPVSGLRVERAAWSSDSVYDLLPLAAERALVAGSHRLTLLEGGRLRDLSDELIYPRRFYRSRHHAARVYLATEFGVRVLDLSTPVPVLSPLADPDVAVRVTSVVERGPNEVWAGTERHGLWRYRYSEAGRLQEARRIDQELGIKTGELAQLSLAELGDGRMLASTVRGFWLEDSGSWHQSELNGLAGLRHPEELLSVYSASPSERWAYGHARVLHDDGEAGWHEHDVRALRRGALIDARQDGEGRLLLASTGSLLLHHGDVAAPSEKAPRALLREVSRVSEQGERWPLPLTAKERLHLPVGDYGVHFAFALPDFERESGRQYQGRLLGFEPNFSEWSTARSYGYWRLEPGDYRLEIRARDSRGRVSETPPFEFTIDPPWYGTRLAQAGFAVLSILLLWAATQGYVRWRTVRMTQEKLALEQLIQTRTRELESANQKLDGMAHRDGLTGIANRRRLDAYLSDVWSQCQQRGRPLSLLLIDVDHFKHYNDTHGHLAGDELLKRLTRTLGDRLRRSEDLLARFGGEEFVVVLPGADADTAAVLAEAMRAAVEKSALGATVSIGHATLVPDQALSTEALIERADAALYSAKNAGRNRVMT